MTEVLEGIRANTGPRRVIATPFLLRDVQDIPRRQWLYGRSAIRKEITTTIAPGGVGKTALSLVEAIAMVTGRDLLGIPVEKPLRVWVWSGEEPEEEMERRIGAIRKHFDIGDDEFGDRFFVDVGFKMPLTLVDQSPTIKVCSPIIDELQRELKDRAIDVLIVDPFVSTHRVNENDNSAIQQAATAWKEVAVAANCAVMLVHHTRKLNGQEATTDSSRGADALPAKARIVRALNPMSTKEGNAFGVDENERKSVFWYDPSGGKGNMSPRASERQWFKMMSVPLLNRVTGNMDLGDEVGVATSWMPPPIVRPTLDAERVDIFRARLGERLWFGSPQAHDRPDWVGFLISEVFEVDRSTATWKSNAKALLSHLMQDSYAKFDYAINPSSRKKVKIVVATPNEGGVEDETLH